MTSNSHRLGVVLFFSFIACFFSPSVLSWAGDSDASSPQWCLKAKTKVEKFICKNDSQASNDDQALSVYYETLLKLVEPGAKSNLVRSQKKWIAERERCGTTAKNAEDLDSCVSAEIRRRSDLLMKDITKRNIDKRLSEFNKFELRTFKDAAFEFQYPSSWHLETTEDGRISLKDDGEEMTLGFENAVTSSKYCTYSEQYVSENDIRRNFYVGKKQIGDREFEQFNRGWIPNGEEEHYYGFFNGHCFAIYVSDDGQRPGRCYNFDGEGQGKCVLAGVEAKDLLAYSAAVIRTIRF